MANDLVGREIVRAMDRHLVDLGYFAQTCKSIKSQVEKHAPKIMLFSREDSTTTEIPMFPSMEHLCVDNRESTPLHPGIVDWFRTSPSFEHLTELVVRDFGVHSPEIARSMAKMARLNKVAFLNGRDPTIEEERTDPILWGVLSRLPIRSLSYTGSFLMPEYIGGLRQLTELRLRDVVHDDFCGLERAIDALKHLRVFEADAYEMNDASIAALGRLLRLEHLHLGFDVVSPTDWASPFRPQDHAINFENQSIEGCFASLETLELFGKDPTNCGESAAMNEPTKAHRWILRAASRNALQLTTVRFEFPNSTRPFPASALSSVERAVLNVGRGELLWLRDWTSLRDLKIHLRPGNMDTLMPALVLAKGLEHLELYNCTSVVGHMTPSVFVVNRRLTHPWPLLSGVGSVALNFHMVYTGSAEYSRFIAYFADFPNLQKLALKTSVYGLPYAKKILEDLGGSRDLPFQVDVTATVRYHSLFEDAPTYYETASSDDDSLFDELVPV